MGKIISINKTRKRVVLTSYITMEEQYEIIGTQVISQRSIMGIGHFKQNRTHSSTWVETMRKRFIKANKEYKR